MEKSNEINTDSSGGVMKDLELIIFDMDGLMFDSEKISYRVWDEVLKKHGYEFDFCFFEKMIGSNLERIKDMCFKQFGNDFPFDDIKTERYQLTNDIIKQQGIPLKQGLLDLLDFLKTVNIKKAVATSSGRDRANMFLNSADITDYFDYILCGDEITKSKPNPEIFLKVAKKLNCNPSKTIVLEDSIAGIIAAYNGGMIPIMVPDMIKPDSSILGKIYRCFISLSEVKDFLQNELNS